MITLSIDVTLLEKSRFKEITRKSGKPAKFCELVIFKSKADELFVKQQVTKEERLAKVEMPILGNAKDWDAVSSPTEKASQPRHAPAAPAQCEDPDVPF